MRANLSKWQRAQAEGNFKGSERLAQLIAKGKAETAASDRVKARAGGAGQHSAAGRASAVVEQQEEERSAQRGDREGKGQCRAGSSTDGGKHAKPSVHAVGTVNRESGHCSAQLRQIVVNRRVVGMTLGQSISRHFAGQA